jgi:hypothetical protein
VDQSRVCRFKSSLREAVPNPKGNAVDREFVFKLRGGKSDQRAVLHFVRNTDGCEVPALRCAQSEPR